MEDVRNGKHGEGIQVGFFGIEKYELLLYLSRILRQLGLRVLLVDYSENGALSAGIPVWDQFGGAGREELAAENASYQTAVDYCGIHFLRELMVGPAVRSRYDCVLIDFGFELEHEAVRECSRAVIVSDQQLHNIHRLRHPLLWESMPVYAVLKDMCPCRITPDYILEEAGVKAEEGYRYVIYQDAWDAKCRISCQYSKLSPFVRISREYREFLKNITKDLFPEFTKSEIDRACRAAEKGEC